MTTNVQSELEELIRGEPVPSRQAVEAVLTDGYALALELEAERLELTRELDRHYGDAEEVLRLEREIARTTTRLRDLRQSLRDASRRFGRNPLAEV